MNAAAANDEQLHPTDTDRILGATLSTAALARAMSYTIRPPGGGTVTAQTIFTFLPVPAWVLLLITLTVLIIIGAVSRRITPMFVGAAAGSFCYVFFAVNLLIGAFTSGAGWAGVAELFIVAGLYGTIVRRLGPHVSRPRRNRGEA